MKRSREEEGQDEVDVQSEEGEFSFESEEEDPLDVERVHWYEFLDSVNITDPITDDVVQLDESFLLSLPSDVWQVLGKILRPRDMFSLMCTSKSMNAMFMKESFFNVWQIFSDRNRVSFFYKIDNGELDDEELVPTDYLDNLCETNFWLFACGHHVVPDADTPQQLLCSQCKGHDFRKSVLRKVKVENAYITLANGAESISEDFDNRRFSIAILSPEAYELITSGQKKRVDRDDYCDFDLFSASELQSAMENDSWDDYNYGLDHDWHNEEHDDSDEDPAISERRESEEEIFEVRWEKHEQHIRNKWSKNSKILEKVRKSHEFFRNVFSFDIGGNIYDFHFLQDKEDFCLGVLIRD